MCLSVTFQIPPSRLGAELSARDVRELAEYYAVQPWDETRGDVRIGLFAASVMSALGSKRAKFATFTPFLSDRGKRQSASDMNAVRLQYRSSHPERFEDN